MKNVRKVLSAFAFVFAIALAVAGNAKVLFTSDFGINATQHCVSGTLVDTVPCGTTDQGLGSCSVSISGVGNTTAYNDNHCLNELYRQQ